MQAFQPSKGDSEISAGLGVEPPTATNEKPVKVETLYDLDRAFGGSMLPVSYTHLTLPTSDLV